MPNFLTYAYCATPSSRWIVTRRAAPSSNSGLPPQRCAELDLHARTRLRGRVLHVTRVGWLVSRPQDRAWYAGLVQDRACANGRHCLHPDLQLLQLSSQAVDFFRLFLPNKRV